GDRIAYFARTEKNKTLILQNVVTKKIETRIELKSVDGPESPDVSPDGREVAFSAMRGAIADIFIINLDTKENRNITNDTFGDYAPTYSPDGKSIIYLARVSGNDKLFRVDLASGEKKQITFGTHDDGGVQFVDNDTIVFPSTATDPNQPIDPEVARNGNIYNIWTLNLKTNELKQYTDTLTGNVSPIVLRDQKPEKIAFVTYYKGDYGIHTLPRQEALHTVAMSDFGSADAGAPIDFTPPSSHTLVPSNIHKKGTFEKLFLEGRPPVALGVTSGGDVFGGTEVTFSDVLGDKQFNLFISSVSQYRTMNFTWVNMEKRLQWALSGYNTSQFYYGQLEGVFYDPYLSQFIDRDLATATRTIQGGTAFAIYPFNRYRRVEVFGGFSRYQETFNDPLVQQASNDYQEEVYGQPLFNNGNMMPFGVAFVQETTIFREFGPLSGSTMRLSYEVAPKISGMLSRQTFDGDARKYFRLAANGLLALRARGFKSTGDNPDFTYFGGNSELRGYEYLQFVGQNAFFANAELRFPLIEAMATPIGILG